ncbi:TPA: exodeoxyribonuclease III [Streptococcus agalactiae]|jgi:exodeoxyribonuclease III|uniref:Exodeoxyribonuclease n=3 Tax=Streptococcus agalactiae TaxID=1311 RepID=Q8DYC4_STRA5|nr:MULTISPECIES: exodeoxyribonuclease III [Streptococcus]EAO61748.1 exodeoxyribonuclease III [Streptococcus agalactiae 18RS21]EPX07765.1 exodeoxyribonuclease [Streptococcus agalactiae MRI Z1-049]MEE3707452.1 exodeoxyribonuclease III [Streptococcus sp. R3]MEE3843522.1 exodeoxyribonuclease III [Streptococcus sp. R4]HEO2249730.1 exodeoxyribonuclease III [Streptococcus agalactiae 515]HEO8209369.1 exodeoxyribonuclease III [Streptococcus agalactiae ADL-350]
MKLISWNIDSLNAALTSESTRALMSRQVIDTLVAEDADIIAIQETKLSAKGPTKKHLEVLETYFPEYDLVWRSSVEPARKGYAGTMFLYRKGLNPIVSFPEIDAPTTMDNEGRIITLELENCYITQVYTPNAGDGLKRLADRQIWDIKYAEYLATLDSQKPVLATGDYNVAHKEIDLANPSSNRRSAGFTAEERQGFTNLLAKGFTDTFRYLHGDVPNVYSWWAQRSRTSKINNTGWRIDYWLTSNRVADKITKSEMIHSGDRQDHTPIILEIEL